ARRQQCGGLVDVEGGTPLRASQRTAYLPEGRGSGLRGRSPDRRRFVARGHSAASTSSLVTTSPSSPKLASVAACASSEAAEQASDTTTTR
ncbi:MAG: hypothetical protein JWM15_497, partial [Cryptosporangiaceae bacterium]|nr:hypothetical protein [Cryptosporangiaceae bacterium]